MKKLLLLTLLLTATALKGMERVPSLADITARVMANYDLDQFSRLNFTEESLPQDLKNKLKEELQAIEVKKIPIYDNSTYLNLPIALAISSNNNFMVTAAPQQAEDSDDSAEDSDSDDDDNFGANFNAQAYILDAQTGVVLHTLKGHNRAITSAAISSDNRFIVTGSKDMTARVWDAQTGAQLHILDHTGEISSVAISLDNKFIVTVSEEAATVCIWEAQTGKLFRICEDSINGVMSSDNRFIIAYSWNQAPIVWDVQTGKELYVLEGHTGPIKSFAISPDNNFIVTGSEDTTARVWDAQTGQQLHVLEGHEGPIRALTISPDNNFIVTCSINNIAYLWDAQTGILLGILQGHTGPINALAISSDSHFIVTGSIDNTVGVWNAQTRELLAFLPAHPGRVNAVAIGSNNNFMVSAGGGMAHIVSIEHLIHALSLEQLLLIKALQNHSQKNPNGFELALEQAELFYTLPMDLRHKLLNAYKIRLRLLYKTCGIKRKRS